MPITMTRFPGPVMPITPDIAERLVELFQDNDKDGFRNLGPGNDTFEYNGTSLYNPATHKYITLHFAQKINAGAGDDRITTSNGNDTIHGGSGNDVISSGGGTDTVHGGSGDDFMFGGAGDDTISGGSGNDLLDGDNFYLNVPGGNDRLNGGSGDDVLYGGGGMDIMTGGTGADTFSFGGRTDSSVWNPDQIRDFDSRQGDELYLPSFHLNGGTPLTFSTGPTTQAGKIWISQLDAGHDMVYVNFDGGTADMAIHVTLANGAPHLTSADFVV